MVKEKMATLVYLPVFPHQNLFCSRENQPKIGLRDKFGVLGSAKSRLEF